MQTKIYALKDEHGEVRYIGKTIKSLSIRLSQHLCEVRRGVSNYRCNWIKSITSRGYFPSIDLIETVFGDGCKEEIAWIKYFREKGVNLVNQTIGGEGKIGYKNSPETRKKISESNMGRICSKETREKIGLANKGRYVGIPLPQETREKMRVARMGSKNPFFGKHHSDATRQKLSKIFTGRSAWNKGLRGVIHHSEETRRKMKESFWRNRNKIISCRVA